MLRVFCNHLALRIFVCVCVQEYCMIICSLAGTKCGWVNIEMCEWLLLLLLSLRHLLNCISRTHARTHIHTPWYAVKYIFIYIYVYMNTILTAVLGGIKRYISIYGAINMHIIDFWHLIRSSVSAAHMSVYIMISVCSVCVGPKSDYQPRARPFNLINVRIYCVAPESFCAPKTCVHTMWPARVCDELIWPISSHHHPHYTHRNSNTIGQYSPPPATMECIETERRASAYKCDVFFCPGSSHIIRIGSGYLVWLRAEVWHAVCVFCER